MPKHQFERWVMDHEWRVLGSFNGSVSIANEGPDRLMVQENGFDGSVCTLEPSETSFEMEPCMDLRVSSNDAKVRIEVDFHSDEDLAAWLLEQQAMSLNALDAS